MDLKTTSIFLLLCLVFTSGKNLPLSFPSTVAQIPVGGQNISTQGSYATSSFSFGGLFFLTLSPAASATTLMAFTNDTYKFVQKEVLEDYQCFNPQYSLNSNDPTSFFLQCSSAPDSTGLPVAWVIRPIQGLFFRVLSNAQFTTSANWTWIESTPYLWDMTYSSIVYIYSYSSSMYIFTGQLVNDFTNWAPDLQDFTWTNLTVIPSPLTLLLTGHLQGVSVLAVVSSYGSYSLVSGSFDGISLLYNDGDKILGLTTTTTSTGGTILSLWDFSKLTTAMPLLISSLSFNSLATITLTTVQYTELSAINFFVSQFNLKTLNVTQVSWFVKGFATQPFYYAPVYFTYPLGYSANLNEFFTFYYGYAAGYPYVVDQ